MQRDVSHAVVDNFKHICVSPRGMHSLRPVFIAKHASVPGESVHVIWLRSPCVCEAAGGEILILG